MRNTQFPNTYPPPPNNQNTLSYESYSISYQAQTTPLSSLKPHSPPSKPSMAFLDEFVKELEQMINYFIEKENMDASKRSQAVYLSMSNITRAIETQFESGNLTPDKFLSQIKSFIKLDENNLILFQKIKFGKGIAFVQNRLKALKADETNLEQVLAGGV